MNSDDSQRATSRDDVEDSHDQQPLVVRALSTDKDKEGQGAEVTKSATAEEAPFSTQVFWLVVWMLKYVPLPLQHRKPAVAR